MADQFTPPPPPPPPPGGYDPTMGGAYMPPPPPAGAGVGQGAGSQDPGMQPPPPPKPPSKPANFQLGAKLGQALNIKVPPHSLQFDEQYFLHLLAGSISLTKDEKLRIIESIPKLKQSQVDELIKIFEEERKKFAELGEEHVPQLEKLAKQHYEDWVDVEMKQEQSSKSRRGREKSGRDQKTNGTVEISLFRLLLYHEFYVIRYIRYGRRPNLLCCNFHFCDFIGLLLEVIYSVFYAQTQNVVCNFF